MQFIDLIWNQWLGFPLRFLGNTFGFDMFTQWKVIAWKVGFIILVLAAIYEIFLRIKKMKNNKLLRETEMELTGAYGSQYVPNAGAPPPGSGGFNIDKDPYGAIKYFKKQKDFAKVGEIYAGMDKHNQAGKFFQKAGDLSRAGHAFVRANKKLKGANILLKAGEAGTAARIFNELGKHALAAEAYQGMGDKPRTAMELAASKKFPEAFAMFLDYFKTSKDTAQLQGQAALDCYTILENEEARKLIPGDELKRMFQMIAEKLAAARMRDDLSAKLFRQTGDLLHAGQVLLRLGRHQEAAQCMREAGKPKEAMLIQAQYYESQGDWASAGAAYEAGENFKKAGDCYSKSNEGEMAGAAYEKAQEWFGAGFAYTHANQWEKAIVMFQHVSEDHPRFAESRQLLGRCFYEAKDYAHCAATLDNHLTGEKVRENNVDYFWMLALAYEQLGQLHKSQEIFLKIRSVNVSYRDVSVRLSNVQSRISMLGDDAGVAPTQAHGKGGAHATKVMNMANKGISDRYELLKELGRGGMGIVYLARDVQLDRQVAIKFLGAAMDDNDEYRNRFIREAKAAAKVNHPNIVAVYDMSAEQGNAFIAMEFVEGTNLHSYIHRKGPLPVREALSIMTQTCAALSAIHKEGIVHRDLKPDNILLAKGGLVKLMDFGLAKGSGNRLTGTNMVMGTPAYMAPEQTLGKECDERSDLYSMGLVFHEMLTGKTMFLDGDVLRRQQTETPPKPSELAKDIPDIVDQIVMKCIEKEPGKRFQSAAQLLDALRRGK